MAFDLGDYVDVAERMAELREKHPNASLRPALLNSPFQVVTIGAQTYIAVVAACYRDDEDTNPGVGMAWEPVPGLTPYTKNSELQNAETSAWGRAIVAALVADTKRGVASRDEVRNRREEPAAAALPEGWASIEEHNEALRLLRAATEAAPADVRLKWYGYLKDSGYKAPYTKNQLDELDAQLLILDGDGAHREVPTEGVDENGDPILALAAAECSLCGSTRAARVLDAHGKARCKDTKGCMESVEAKIWRRSR